jgi:hypothetical protein
MVAIQPTKRRVPARCNKRACQARRTLSMMPEHYVNWPRCHIVGCDGKMYADKFRMKKANQAADRGEVCECDGRPGKHRRGQAGCRDREDVIIQRSLLPTPKHSPIKPCDDDIAPF